jgi:hypothetical protein
MNIAEQYNQNVQREQQDRKLAIRKKRDDLANRIMTAFRDEDTIKSMENYLIKHGCVSITDFGCLCQGGFCSWQVGLNELLQPLRDEWKEKGVQVIPSLKLIFQVPNKSSYDSRKMTIAELKEWNIAYQSK